MEGISDPVEIGLITAAHGVSGTLRVRATGSGRHLRKGSEPMVGGERRRILAVRETPKGFLVDLEGIGDRASAVLLRGVELTLDRSELDEPEAEEFYVGDLIGLPAISEAGEYLGVVSETFETAAHEVLVVRRDGSPEELYVPFTYEHVPEVDLRSGRLILRPPRE